MRTTKLPQIEVNGPQGLEVIDSDSVRKMWIGLENENTAAFPADEVASLVRAIIVCLEWPANLVLSGDSFILHNSKTERGHVVQLETSGTTGKPKVVKHDLRRLFERTRKQRPSNWGIGYDPLKFAGLSVLLQALRAGGRVTIPGQRFSASEKVEFLARHDSQFLASTPSFMNIVASTTFAGFSGLARVVMGGEIVSQKTINSLEKRFPGIHISHIYATSELGSIFSVSDHKEGFPAKRLGPGGNRPELCISDIGTLKVRLKDHFVDTGDLVSVVGDRVLFRGRVDRVITIGGLNLSLDEVEQFVLRNPKVRDCRARSLPSRTLGNLFELTIACDMADEGQKLGDEVSQNLQHSFGRHARPVKVLFNRSFSLNSNGKKV